MQIQYQKLKCCIEPVHQRYSCHMTSDVMDMQMMCLENHVNY